VFTPVASLLPLVNERKTQLSQRNRSTVYIIASAKVMRWMSFVRLRVSKTNQTVTDFLEAIFGRDSFLEYGRTDNLLVMWVQYFK